MSAHCCRLGRFAKHLLDLVLEKLESLKDYLQFGLVCAPWYDVTKDNQTKRMINLSHQVPMLIVPNKSEHTWDIYDPFNITSKNPN